MDLDYSVKKIVSTKDFRLPLIKPGLTETKILSKWKYSKDSVRARYAAIDFRKI